MKIDIMHALYIVSMILLAFVSAIVITKTLSKWLKLDEKEKDEEEDDA
ncbi:hypothetical protein MNB_SV-10-644 [hydrothermal vent metagenome]|uniref:Uncharacterized protein n=1 Tax=hydrothermal vent metagenome TaxID=652676 RepID=A0A1W1BHD9_9ZZZZ